MKYFEDAEKFSTHHSLLELKQWQLSNEEFWKFIYLHSVISRQANLGISLLFQPKYLKKK